MPSKSFPPAILQMGIKISIQPPKGVRNNVIRTLSNDVSLHDFEYFGESTIAPHYKRLVYNLAVFHACVLERRKFGGIGWNIPYEWMSSDLKTSILQLQLMLKPEYSKAEEI